MSVSFRFVFRVRHVFDRATWQSKRFYRIRNCRNIAESQDLCRPIICRVSLLCISSSLYRSVALLASSEICVLEVDVHFSYEIHILRSEFNAQAGKFRIWTDGMSLWMPHKSSKIKKKMLPTLHTRVFDDKVWLNKVLEPLVRGLYLKNILFCRKILAVHLPTDVIARFSSRWEFGVGSDEIVTNSVFLLKKGNYSMTDVSALTYP